MHRRFQRRHNSTTTRQKKTHEPITTRLKKAHERNRNPCCSITEWGRTKSRISFRTRDEQRSGQCTRGETRGDHLLTNQGRTEARDSTAANQTMRVLPESHKQQPRPTRTAAEPHSILHCDIIDWGRTKSRISFRIGDKSKGIGK